MSSEKLNEVQVANLVAKSQEAMANAYCPYSNFPVGTALLCEDGTVYTGCNIENAAYTVGICAERTAAAKAVSEGKLKFLAIAVTTKVTQEFCSPCGACRQFLSEFGLDLIVYMSKPDSTWIKTSIRDLLPMAFTPESLSK